MKQIVRKTLQIVYKFTSDYTGILNKIPFINYSYHLLIRYAFADINGQFLVTMNGHKMYISDDFLGFYLIGEYEPETTDLFVSLLHEGDVVVDIGAHIGYYTLLAARTVGKDGKVFAFEPDPDNYALLVKNVEMNGYNNVTAVQKQYPIKLTLHVYLLEKSHRHIA